MRAALFTGPGKIEVSDLPIRKVDKDELLVRIGACGVCGTDFHIVEGKAPARVPVIIGHEFTGEVIEMGNSVSVFNTGDKVAVDPNIYCGYCEYCRSGRINLCSNLKALGVTINGGFAEYCIVPVKQAYLLPQSLSYNVAAFAEPLSCCIHGIDQADIKQGNKVAIIGAGPIGLILLQLSILRGAGSVMVMDYSVEKRTMAKKLGAEYTLDPDDQNSFNEYFEYSKGGADIVIECAGNEKSAANCFNIIKKGGLILLFGLADRQAHIQLYLQSFFHKELTIKSSLLNPFTFQSAVDLLISGKLNVEIFQPGIVQLTNENINNLFFNGRNLSVIKYVINPNG